MTTNAYEMLTHGVQDFAQPHPDCKRDVLGERWTVCHAPGDGPCYCDVVVKAGPPIDPLPDPGPEGPGVPGDERPRAVSLQSIAIDSRIKRCMNCDGEHFTWSCPEIGDVSTAIAVYDTAEIWHLWGISRTLLAAKLARLTAPQLLCQAIDFAGWLNEQTRANLPAASVLRIWEQFIADDDDLGRALPRVA